jgi:hypothetical protein
VGRLDLIAQAFLDDTEWEKQVNKVTSKLPPKLVKPLKNLL